MPGAPSTMTSSCPFKPRLTRSSRSVRQAASLSPPMFLTASSTFWPSCLTPRATRSEIDVDFLSSLTRTTVPSRINRMIGSSVRERAFQASQSPLTLRQTRLTVSFPTSPELRELMRKVEDIDAYAIIRVDYQKDGVIRID